MTQEQIWIVKRDGSKEVLNLDKIHNMLYKACEGLTGVSVSDIAIKAKLSFFNGMTSREIHTALIKSAADLICEESVNYQYVAGNLLNYELRKNAWGSMEPPALYDHVVKMVDAGFYTPELLDLYSKEDYDRMDGFIDHDRDFKMTYIGLNEYMNKYAIRNRASTDFVPLETPQLTYMLIAALSVLDSKSIKDIKSMYGDFSQWNISLPTPIMAGLRGTVKQFSSCCLIDSGDSIDSITATNEAIIKYSAKRAGIGVDASKIRAEGDSVGGGATKHTGVVPFLRSFEGALKSSAQGGIRGSSACVYLTIWHLEVMDLLVLKNNKGTPDSRVRKMDYGFQINNYIYNRLIDGKDITLFSPSHNETPGLYDAYFDKDPTKFAKLYEKYEKDPKIRKRVVNSRDLFTSLVTERKETGRIYVFNVDNVNQNSTYKIPITMSNLCAEITLPTVPLNTMEEEVVLVDVAELPLYLESMSSDIYVHKYEVMQIDDGKVSVKITRDKGLLALCTLSAINLGNVKNLDDLETICRNSVRALDNLLDYQDYMIPAAKRHSMLYRPLGIGITNLAYYLAKNGLKYSDDRAYELMHDTMEAISFYCIKASVELAKNRGACLGYKDTTWSEGILPIDRYNKNVDSIINPKLKLDWKWLREQLAEHGIRNASLLAAMPAESSSRIFNSTNGVEPVRSLITVKSNKDHVSKQVVPEFSRLKNKYDMLWDMKSMDGLIKMMAVIQKFMCQSISTNTSYNPLHYDRGEIPMSILLGDILKSNYYGLKTLYYNNLRDGAEDTVVMDAEQIDVSSAEDLPPLDDECDSCSI